MKDADVKTFAVTAVKGGTRLYFLVEAEDMAEAESILVDELGTTGEAGKHWLPGKLIYNPDCRDDYVILWRHAWRHGKVGLLLRTKPPQSLE